MGDKTIIKCKKIKKSFGEQKVIQDFSYTFTDGKIYILFGYSGCGKTTLLNILSGAIPFDEGNLFIFNEEYHANENKKEIRDDIAYITQNTYFVDYLNIQDNLELCLTSLEDKPLINEYLENFKLSDKTKSYPNELSGGERQRMSIIQALLKKQKILLLDEPTSSLDEKNKELFYSILTELKKDHLIICATHDDSMKTYADEIITFDDLSQYKSDESEMEKSITSEIKKPSLLKYMLKQLTYKKREKLSGFFLVLVLTIILLMINACFSYEEKLLQSLMNTYDIHSLRVECSVETDNYCEDIRKEYHVNSFYGFYSYLTPPVEQSGQSIVNNNYYDVFRTLPFEKELINNKNIILYGTYFENENDILLGYEEAMGISDNPETLVDTKIEYHMINGKEKLRVAGILKPNIDSDPFLINLTGEREISRYKFINSKYVEKFLYDDKLGEFEINGEEATYLNMFFEDSDDLYEFYKKYKKNTIGKEEIMAIKMNTVFYNYYRQIELLGLFTYPITVFAFFVILIFYYQTKNIQNHYTGHIFPVYYYYGYNWNKILFYSFITEIINVCIKFFTAFILSVIFTYIGNIVCETMRLTNFTLFMMDSERTMMLFMGMLMISSILTLVSLLMKKRRGWLEVIKEGDDLL